LLSTDSKSESDRFATELAARFTTSDRGDLTYAGGAAIVRWRSRRCIKLHQEPYITHILGQYGLSNINSAKVPFPPDVKLSKPTDQDRTDGKGQPYGTLVGQLLFLSCVSRPDITYAVNQLTKFLSLASLIGALLSTSYDTYKAHDPTDYVTVISTILFHYFVVSQPTQTPSLRLPTPTGLNRRTAVLSQLRNQLINGIY
jgi:hypothetical protein